MKVVTILGARPQFIKAAPVSQALRAAGHSEFLVHTGQHYDHLMSAVFFEEMNLAAPNVDLEVGSDTHARQTGQMMAGIEEILARERPDWTLVYGDTNSTLAGALAAAKLDLALVHVEAGLRSYNRRMPEEHNRVLADHCADLLLCPTATAVANLAREGLEQNVHLVGDTMFDAVLQFEDAARSRPIVNRLGLSPRGYFLATVHRPANADSADNLRILLGAFASLPAPVVLPVHPRTRQRIADGDLARPFPNLRLIDPVGYMDMLALEMQARAILTDSGGVQKEAFLFGVPCITLREETEWVETVVSGWNTLAGADPARIVAAATRGATNAARRPELFGDGHAAERIVSVLSRLTHRDST